MTRNKKMMPPVTLEEYKQYARKANYSAVFEEVPAGLLTPEIVYSVLSGMYESQGVILEDLHPDHDNKHSLICFDRIKTLKIDTNEDREPLAAIREYQSQFKCAVRAEAAGLITSAAGFITYDAVRYFEEIPDRHAADFTLPIILFNFYALSITFNHATQTILISRLVESSEHPEKSYQQARDAITGIIKALSDIELPERLSKINKVESQIETDVSDTEFMHMVEQAKKYIIRGDAFQIVLSRCFKRNYSVSPFDIYLTLRKVNPAPFLFYIPTENNVIIGASPERLIRVRNQQVTVNPIAGTRKRHGESTDEAIEEDLLSDTKEIAEHMMLVDLARNDVGAVSEPGSVAVTELLKVKHYAHVSHITSTVTGKLQGKYDVLDAFAASFPAGTLSGAPKIRAMHIIDELETSRRGLYGGVICRLDAAGNFDSCIAIRMAVLQDGVATVRAGAGIVYDSHPESEAQETRNKAHSMFHAIARAHGE
jgi:anthranilate synthase component 1